MNSFRLFALTALCLLGIAATSHADKSTAAFILPQIGQRGSQVTVRVEGTHLETAEEVLFYRAGIRCTQIEQLDTVPHIHFATPTPAEPGQAIQLTLDIAPDAPLGEYYLRIRTKKKLSELLSFWVTPYPVVPEAHPHGDTKEKGNDRPERAQDVPFGSTIVGYTAAGGQVNDFDLYRVSLTKNQLCSAQILNSRLGTHHYGGLTDMRIEVRSPTNKRVARAIHSPLFGQDPFVSFRAAESGDYLIEVSQQMDSEEMLRHYALHIANFPRPEVTYPLGGQAGTEVDLQIFYADGATDFLKAKLPTNLGKFEEQLIELTAVTDLPEIPSPNQLKVAEFPNVFESGGHHQPENAQSISQPLPVALNGIIKTEGEKDWFRFSAKKGERYRVRAYARTLGSKLDPFIWIKPAEGNPSRRSYEEDDSLWDGHDWEGHHYRHQVQDRLDPVFMFEPDEDGDYLLGITDTRREFGEDYIYRIEFQPHRDSLFTYYTEYPSQAAIVRDVIGIHQDSTLTRPISIQNGFGSLYDGPIRLEARGLPPEISFESPIFTKNDPIILAAFTAKPGAKFQSALFELIPHPIEPGVHLDGAFAQTSASTDRRGGYAMVFNKTRKLALAVLEEAPFSVRLEQPKIGLAKNAELDLLVKVERKGDFTGAIYAEMDWLPRGVTKQPPLIINEGEDVGSYKLLATNQAEAGKHRLSITAREYEGGNTSTGVGFHYIASPLIDVEITNPYLQIELERAAVEQGKPGEIIGKITHLRPFQGDATAKLLRLPTGVTQVSEPKIKPGDEIVRFQLNVAEDALTGQYKELACDIAISDAGQQIHQQSGDGVLRIDPKRKP